MTTRTLSLLETLEPPTRITPRELEALIARDPAALIAAATRDVDADLALLEADTSEAGRDRLIRSRAVYLALAVSASPAAAAQLEDYLEAMRCAEVHSEVGPPPPPPPRRPRKPKTTEVAGA